MYHVTLRLANLAGQQSLGLLIHARGAIAARRGDWPIQQDLDNKGKRICDEAQGWRLFEHTSDSRGFVDEGPSLHQHLALTGIEMWILSKPGWRFETSSPGLRAPIDPHVEDCREDKGCEAIAKRAHDRVDRVCSQTMSA